MQEPPPRLEVITPGTHDLQLMAGLAGLQAGLEEGAHLEAELGLLRGVLHVSHGASVGQRFGNQSRRSGV
jgi:hypothetical protein